MVDISRGSRESKAIEWIYFPMALLVVLLHTNYTSDTSDVAHYLGVLISGSLVKIAVPTFFFLSGYLFFAKYDHFGKAEYVEMLKKKALTLLLPYIIWNFIAYYGYGVTNGFAGDIRPWELGRIFWAQSDGYVATSVFGYKFSILCSPAAGVLWFIRDLMVVMLFSPVIWYVVRRLKMWSLLVILLIWQLRLGIPIKGFGLAAWCFFPLGATFSILGKNAFLIFNGYKKIIIPAFVLMWAACCMPGIEGYASRFINDAFILTGVIFVYVVAYQCAEGGGSLAPMEQVFIYYIRPTWLVYFLSPAFFDRASCRVAMGGKYYGLRGFGCGSSRGLHVGIRGVQENVPCTFGVYGRRKN